MDRAAVEARLDRLVATNRFTIAVVFPVVGALLLVGSAEGAVPEPLAFHPLLVLAGVFVMRSPLLVGVLPTVDRRAGVGVLALATYAYAVEYVGVRTGLPYGEFHYGASLGPTVAGVPVGLPVFFLPLVVNAYLLCLLLLGPTARRAAVRVPVVAATVVAMDLVLDPGAVALGFWTYPGGGAYYGVPALNFAGWAGSAVVSVALLDASFDVEALTARLERCPFMLDDLVSFVVLWGAVNAWFGSWLPVALAAGFGAGLLRTERFDARMLPLVGRWT
jgi:putative membrane protein